MEVTAIKDLMSQFDASSLREFSYKNGAEDLVFSKNEITAHSSVEAVPLAAPAVSATPTIEVAAAEEVAPVAAQATGQAEGEEVVSPLVGVAYLSPGPEKSAFVSVGDSVKKGQTLMIIEAMKVMNEIPAPHDGMVTEILVANEDVVEFGQGLVRIK